MKKLLIILSLFSLPVLADESSFKNLNEYFEYLPNEVHKNWIPYRANTDYEVTIQFKVKKNGEITDPVVVKSTNKNANASAIQAVKDGAPYKPLPVSYPGDSVKTQVELQFLKQ